MNDVTAEQPAWAIRASDTERDKTAALLQRQFAEGRLTMDELEERVAAAYSARTREQLGTLTTDLPSGGLAAGGPAGRPIASLPIVGQPAQRGMALDPCLLCLLIVVFPPAGLIYWLMTRRCGAGGAAARTA